MAEHRRVAKKLDGRMPRFTGQDAEAKLRFPTAPKLFVGLVRGKCGRDRVEHDAGFVRKLLEIRIALVAAEGAKEGSRHVQHYVGAFNEKSEWLTAAASRERARSSVAELPNSR